MLDGFYLPPKPAIIVPSEGRGPFAALSLDLARRGVPRNIRRAVVREIERLAGERPAIIRPALADLEKFSKAPISALGAGGGSICAALGGAPVFSYSKTDNKFSTASTSSLSVSSVAITTPGLIVVAGALGEGVSSITSVTINGVTATVVSAASGGLISFVAYAVVSSGSSVTVAINTNANMSAYIFAVYSILNYSSSTPHHTNSSSAGSSTTLNTPAQPGAIIAATEWWNGDNGTPTGTGVTVDYNQRPAWTQGVIGSASSPGSQTGATISFSGPSGSFNTISAASFK
jgi:hypothetical protein